MTLKKETKKSDCTMLIFILMLLTGFVIYYLFLSPEHFYADDPSTQPNNCPTVPEPIYKSIISKSSGVGINITAIDSANKIYQIQSIPVNQTDILGGVYAIGDDGLLTVVVQNINDTTQQWKFVLQNTVGSQSVYSVQPNSQVDSNIPLALQYENGNLSLRPYNAQFDSQRWLLSTNKFNRGIPVLSFNPLSLYTPEFNANGTVTGSTGFTNSLNDQNTQQATDVLNLIKMGFNQYLSQLNQTTNGTGNTSESSLGNGDNTINVNLNMSRSSSSFTDVNGTKSKSTNVLDLLDKYESASNPNDQSDFTLYKLTDLQNSMNTENSRYSNALNPNDWVYKSIGNCNCQL